MSVSDGVAAYKLAVDTIRALRKSKGWTARDLADRTAALGSPISRSTIARHECGERQDMTLTELVTFAAAFGVRPGSLLDGDALMEEARQRASELRAEADRIEREAGL